MGVTTTKTNKPLNPRGNDQSPKGYNRASLFSGKALDFDGVNDQINITTNDLDFGANDFSVSAIVNWTGSYADGKLAYAEKNASGSQLASWQIRTDPSGSILFQANIDGLGWVAVTYDGVLDILAKGLTHLTFVRVGTGATLYINGQFYSNGTGSIGATLDTPNGDFCIGNRIGANNYWNGLVSNFKVFNVALTAAQVADLYNNPEKVVPTGVDNTALKLWLPMMEGAGTTAYDGSGNGNHGTISGATYVNGVGSPVAQSAVMDWNKGMNLLANSVGANKFVNSWAKSNTTINGDVTDPVGGNDAIEVTMNNFGLLYHTITAFSNGTGSIYMRSSTAGVQVQIGDPTGSPYETKTLTTDWVRYDYSDASSIGGLAIYNSVEGGTITIELAFPQVNAGATATPFVPTLSTAQPNPVLLPQGLTTGRDITGVNLFENVRKQGALNLDGNSWAEVHDNGSLDFSSGMTLEAWFQIEANSFGRHVLGKWNFPANKREYLIYWNGSVNKIECYFGNGGAAQSANISVTPTGQWVHFVSTTDGSTITPYLNGVAGTTATQTQPLGDSDIDLKIGTDDTNTSAQYRMNTPIAQPRIYNRALTAEEVQRSYDSGKNIYTNS